MKKGIWFIIFPLVIGSCTSKQNEQQLDTPSQYSQSEVISKVIGDVLTSDAPLSSEQVRLKSMLQLIMVDYLKIDTINKSAHLTLTKDDCLRMKLPYGFYEYIQGELENTMHAVDSMGLWKEWSTTFLELQAAKE